MGVRKVTSCIITTINALMIMSALIVLVEVPEIVLTLREVLDAGALMDINLIIG